MNQIKSKKTNTRNNYQNSQLDFAILISFFILKIYLAGTTVKKTLSPLEIAVLLGQCHLIQLKKS